MFAPEAQQREAPYSSQGWNRYSYVGNSPLNHTDPSGYCFMGCAWNSAFKAIGAFLRKFPIIGAIIKVAATAICTALLGPGCAPVAAFLSSAFITGVTTGSWSKAFRAGAIAAAQVIAFDFIGSELQANFGSRLPEFGTTGHIVKIASHAALGCASAAAMGGNCGQGAIGAAVSAGASPFMPSGMLGVVASGVVGGAAAAASGGKFGPAFANAFADAAATAAFGYMFNGQGGKGLAAKAVQGLQYLATEFGKLGYELLASEATFVTNSGVRIRIDGVFFDPQTKSLLFGEAKIGDHADATRNQAKGFSELNRGEGTFRGDNAKAIADRLGINPNSSGHFSVPESRISGTYVQTYERTSPNTNRMNSLARDGIRINGIRGAD